MAFGDKVERLSLKIRRHKNDPCGEWKNFQIFLGDQKLHEESWPSYGPVATWKTWTYDIPAVDSANASPYLRIGFNSDNSDYYIDDVTLSVRISQFSIRENSISATPRALRRATLYTTRIMIPSGSELDVYTSRYTYWNSPIRGHGRLNIHSGGERSFIGNSSAQLPDWSKFDGDVHIYPWPEVNTSVKAGFYGGILQHGGFKFDPGKCEKFDT